MVASGPTATPSGASHAQTFRERARQEADRYGPDPWIFVRELLQNSRDAGASSVAFSVEDDDGEEVVRCRDNGEGMSFHHARKYLFALYASSKETSSNQAGKFGVGFWSILRFDPTQITIRCCTASGERWGLQLQGTLEQATQVHGLDAPGTEITLRRRGGDGRLEHRVFDAVWQSARYLHRRDNPRQLMTRLRRLFQRAGLDQMEINILRGILTAVQKSAGAAETAKNTPKAGSTAGEQE